MAKMSSPYIRAILRLFIRVGLCSCVFVDCRTRGDAWIIGWRSRGMLCVDAMDARST